MDKDWKKIAEKLPVEPSGDLVNGVLSGIYDGDALGTPMLLFHREPVTLAEPLDEIMCPEDWERAPADGKAPLGRLVYLHQLRRGLRGRVFRRRDRAGDRAG